MPKRILNLLPDGAIRLWIVSGFLAVLVIILSYMGDGNFIHAGTTLLSLMMSFPAVIICYMVLNRWNNEYREYCIAIDKKPDQYLIAGVYIGFVGSIVDNTWWGLAWTFHFLEASDIEYIFNGKVHVATMREFFFDNGVFSNTVFRQGALIWAGLLHIHADSMSKHTHALRLYKRKEAIIWTSVSVLVGLIFIAFLVAARAGIIVL